MFLLLFLFASKHEKAMGTSSHHAWSFARLAFDPFRFDDERKNFRLINSESNQRVENTMRFLGGFLLVLPIWWHHS